MYLLLGIVIYKFSGGVCLEFWILKRMPPPSRTPNFFFERSLFLYSLFGAGDRRSFSSMLPPPLTSVPFGSRATLRSQGLCRCAGGPPPPVDCTFPSLSYHDREICPVLGVVSARWPPPSARRLHLPVAPQFDGNATA